MKNTSDFSDWLKQKLEEEKENFKNIKSKLIDWGNKKKQKIDEFIDDSNYTVPIINGLFGDKMEQKDNSAYVNLSFRYQSRDITVEKLGEIFDLTQYDGKIYIFVHGLWNDESIFHSEPTAKLQRLGTYFEEQQNARILYIRYNTGLHISQNGRALSNLLQSFVERYNKEIKKLVMISHSMGGLVTRSSCHYSEIQKQDWTKLLKKVFLIGVPNEGSYLARAAYMTQYFLRKLDPTSNRELAKFMDIRSNGIKDLSFGYLVDEDWQDIRNGYVKNMKATKVYPLPNVDYYLIAGTMLDEKQKNILFTFFGDGLVEKESALSKVFLDNIAKSKKVEMKLFPKENHLSLLESKEVLEYIKSSIEEE